MDAIGIAIAQGITFKVSKLVEDEKRVVAKAAVVPVPCRAFLRTVGRADRAIHVERDILQSFAVMHRVDPLARQVCQSSAIVAQYQYLSLEPPHLARGRGLSIHSPSTHYLTHHRIKCQSIRVIHILVSSQPTEYRLTQQADQKMQTIVASTCILQHAAS